ncbi:MAG: TonB-dependent receptor [Saprospiraceae bacterium]|nr:TonB-dependent receptor [Saprospiraceae bacterium]
MFNKAFIFTAVACLTAFTIQAQNTITGKVTLNNSEQPLSEVVVILDNSNVYDITNLDGVFMFEDISAGNHTITLTSIGFKTVTESIEISNNLALDFTMEEEIVDIPGVTISTVSTTGGMLGSLELPPSTNYISAKELAQINTTDINKALLNIPGVNLQEEDGFGLRPNIGLRGTGSERSSKITVMEDEVLAAPAPYAAPSAYYFPTMGRMSGIEVRKGSSQIEYGPFTTGGVINLISTPIPTSFKANLRGNYGDFSNRNFLGNVGGKVGQFSYLVETFQYGSNGFKNLPNNADTGFGKQDYLAKVKWENAASAKTYHSLQFKAGIAFEESDETYLGLSQADFEANAFNRYAGSQSDHMDTDHQQFALTHVVKPSEHLVIKTTGYSNNFARNWYKLDKVNSLTGEQVSIASLLANPSNFTEQFDLVAGALNSGTTSVLDVKANNREYYSRGVQTKANISFNSDLDQNLVLGVRYHTDQMDRFQWVDGYSINDSVMRLEHAGVQGTESNRLENAQAFSAYANYDVTFNQLTISPGVRYEDVTVERENFGTADPERIGTDLSIRENSEQVVIPGVGLQYALNDAHQLFAGVHRGFAPPGSTPETEAESSVNYELGYRMLQNNTFFSAAAFYNDYSNLLGSDVAAAGGSGEGDLFNGGAARTFGIELAGQTNFIVNEQLYLPVNLAYTYTNAAFQSSFESDFDGWGDVVEGDELPYLAPHQLNASVGLQAKKFGGFIRGNFIDDMRTAPGQGALTPDNSIDGRFLLNADLNIVLNKHFSVLGNVNNILDEVYAVSQRPSGLRPGMPRAFTVGIDASF